MADGKQSPRFGAFGSARRRPAQKKPADGRTGGLQKAAKSARKRKGTQLSTAPPGTKSAVLFNPDADGGYYHFMHVSWEVEQCDKAYDAGRENEYGGEYGPYQIGRFTKATAGGSMIYFTMSTCNPYNVVLMRAKLVLQ